MSARFLLLTAVLGLAGCAPNAGASDEARATIDGLRAFQAGDTAAIQAAEGRLAALYPPPTPYPNPCTREDYVQRRQATFTGFLQTLERQSERASSEEDRLARLQQALVEVAPSGAQPNSGTCLRSPDKALYGAIDTAERVAVLAAARDIIVAWTKTLGHPIEGS